MESILEFIIESQEIEGLNKHRCIEASFYVFQILKKEPGEEKRLFYEQLNNKLQRRLNDFRLQLKEGNTK